VSELAEECRSKVRIVPVVTFHFGFTRE
jgi:hypothetical protein